MRKKYLLMHLRFTVIFILAISGCIFPIAPQVQAQDSANIQSASRIDFGRIIELVNNERRTAGYGPLKLNTQLTRTAQLRATDMSAQHYFSHTNPQGSGLKYFVQLSGYGYKYAGENLAINYYDNISLVQAWMDSPKHKEAMLRPAYQEIGLASAQVQLGSSINLVIVMELGTQQ